MSILTLGQSDIEVNRIGLGAMPLSLPGHPDKTVATDVIRSFIESGGSFIDTANVYCSNKDNVGHNERLIHRCLKSLGALDTVRVASKGGLRRINDDWDVDATPMWLRVSCENSLVDLNCRSIFLYQLHAPDPVVPLLESVGELVRMREEGLIQHIGLCNVSRKQLKMVLKQTEILSVQNRCNLFHANDIEKGMIELCQAHNVTYICHSPVGGHYQHKSLMRKIELRKIASHYDTTPYVIALAWLLARGENVMAIPGASQVASIEDSMKAGSIKLKQEDLAILNLLAAISD